MKFSRLWIIAITALLFVGCSAKTSRGDKHRETPHEKKIKETIVKTRMCQSTGSMIISYRKLTLSEIAEHLEMDEETAKLHLKATNVHGYYSLSAKNIPSEGEFTLYHVGLDSKIHHSKDFFVNGNGQLVTKMDELYVDLPNSFLFFSNYLPGEPADFVLASKDGKMFSAAHIIPNPIQIMDRKRRVLSVELNAPDKKQYLVHCSGCRPRKEYLLVTRFENERFAFDVEANEFGEVVHKIAPTAPWLTGGDAVVELKGDEFDDPLIVEFQWGL